MANMQMELKYVTKLNVPTQMDWITFYYPTFAGGYWIVISFDRIYSNSILMGIFLECMLYYRRTYETAINTVSKL